MKKTKLTSILFIFLAFACGKAEKRKKASSAGNEILETEMIKSFDLKISNPESYGGGMVASDLFQDTLGCFLPSKPKDKIFIVDLKNQQFVDEIPLDPNFITYPSGIQVVSRDSIFISDHQFPVIFLINHSGEVLDSYNLYRENLWDLPQEGFPNFSLYFGFGKTFYFNPNNKSFLLPLKQIDLWYFIEQKGEFPTFAEFEIQKENFTGLYGHYPGIYGSKENNFLPFFLSHPIMEVNEGKVIISYPLYENLLIYDLEEGILIEEKNGSIPSIELGKPLVYSIDNFDYEGERSFSLKNSFFGNFFYVQKQKKYVRMFLECVKGVDGNCLAKKLHALIFDQNLDLLEVKVLPGDYPPNYFMYQIGFDEGILSKPSELKSDDIFSPNEYFKID
ncbi:DUF4221 family protein [Algoriphagus faecimaris]|uniref:DUF4221 family protein n=1 Tax=Algoriphagus faecimaris TaxID=686796 RepID=UPI00146D0BBB|nr:DUF4221 family protein [Algoriphagus faecimaris]